MERVKGVMSKPCSRCGAELTARAQRDGGLAYGPCVNCQPAESRETAKVEDPSEPNQSVVRATGTDIEE